jgi:hypothetical protein
MDGQLDETMRKVEAAGSADRLQALAARIGAQASAKAVFADPVEREGVTVIPVARVRWGFGGGFGEGDGSSGSPSGSGGGGGVQASPMGFIEVHDGRAEYRSVRDPMRLAIAWLLLPVSAAAAAVVMVTSAWLAARSVRSAFRIRRRSFASQLPHLPELRRPHISDLPRPLRRAA